MRRNLSFPSVLGAASAATAALVWVVAFLTGTGVDADSRVFAALSDAGIPQLRRPIEVIAMLASPPAFILFGLTLVAVALVRRRPLLATVVPVVLLAANTTTQALQAAIPRMIERPEVGLDHAMAWPSGHAGAAMSLALCGVLVASPRWRPAAAMLGAGYAVAVGYAQIALGAHLPSDVLGGYLIAASFALLGVAALGPLEARRPRAAAARDRIGTPIAAPALGALGVVLAACVAVLATDPGSSEMAQHIPALAAGSSIAALGAMLIGGLGMALRTLHEL